MVQIGVLDSVATLARCPASPGGEKKNYFK